MLKLPNDLLRLFTLTASAKVYYSLSQINKFQQAFHQSYRSIIRKRLLRCDSTTRRTEHFLPNGFREGRHEFYFDGGDLWFYVNYVNNRAEGLSECWSMSTGEQVNREYYLNDRRVTSIEY